MSKNLVIVESPSKSHTIEKYLGSDYKVLSSKGHIRDLSTKGKYGLGVDVENNFNPDYVILKGKKKDVEILKKEAKKADHVYLATDLDREGEAISWHLYKCLDLDENKYADVIVGKYGTDKTITSENIYYASDKNDEKVFNSLEAVSKTYSEILAMLPEDLKIK